MFDEENGNLFYPDTGVNYYLGRVSLPPGGELVIRGRYPHARYTSFNSYDELFRPVDALADVDIRPERGSTNPFLAGNRRDLPRRDYEVRVVSDPAPDGPREPNTVYLGSDGPAVVRRLGRLPRLPARPGSRPVRWRRSARGRAAAARRHRGRPARGLHRPDRASRRPA